MSGILSGVASAARWKLSYMSAHAVGLFGLGAEPPPDSSEPSRLLVMSAPLTASRSAWVIWPIFSSRLIRPSRSATRTGTGWVGSRYGGSAATARAAVSAPMAIMAATSATVNRPLRHPLLRRWPLMPYLRERSLVRKPNHKSMTGVNQPVRDRSDDVDV